MSLRWVEGEELGKVAGKRRHPTWYLIGYEGSDVANWRFPVAFLDYREGFWYFLGHGIDTGPLSADLEEAKAIALVRYRLEK